MHIILIAGKARSGKDTTATIIQQKLENLNKKVLRIAYADYLKYICKNYFGWDGNKGEQGRYILQNVGTNRVRENLKQPNYWVDRVCDIIKFTEGMYDYILITDCRFPNEIEIPKSLFKKVSSLKIIRQNFKSSLTKEQLNHPSEIALDKYEFDYIIHNDGGILQLEYKVNQLLNKIMKSEVA